MSLDKELKLTIEKGVPLPASKRPSVVTETFQKMVAGDSVEFPPGSVSPNTLYTLAKRIFNGHYRISKMPTTGAYRVWRVK